MLGVGLRVGGALDLLRRVGQGHRLVVKGLQLLEEAVGGIDRILDLLLGAPAHGRALLEQAARIRAGVVAVVDVGELGFLHRGGDPDGGCTRGHLPLGGRSGDHRGVRRLLRCQGVQRRTHQGGAFLAYHRGIDPDEVHRGVEPTADESHGKHQGQKGAAPASGPAVPTMMPVGMPRAQREHALVCVSWHAGRCSIPHVGRPAAAPPRHR